MSGPSPTDLWGRVNKHYQSTRRPVHVAVAYTADAAAASLTLASLLKASLVQYDIQPIATVEELRQMVESATSAQEDARLSDDDPVVDELFLLVGLGAALELSGVFDVSRHVVVVLDAYRPVHLSNLRAQDGERLLLWGIDRITEEVEDFFRAQREAAARTRRRRRRRAATRRRRRLRRQYGDGRGEKGGDGGGDDDDEGDYSDDDGSDGDSSIATSEEEEEEEDAADMSLSLSQSQERVNWLLPEELPPYLETSYYACERAGRSCAVEAHDLAVLLHRFKDATLWHAAVGLCDLLNRRLIDYGTYLVEMRPLHDAVAVQHSVRGGGGDGLDSDGNADEDGDVDGGEGGGGGQRGGRGSNSMLLHNTGEEQLHLLRHTSLWEAIWNHPVTASVLRLHHAEDGEGLLRHLLASCGVSARMAQQPWREVPHADKADALRLVQGKLREHMERHSRLLALPNEVRCISRTVGYSTRVSSFDACTLHEAILAAVPPHSALTVAADFPGDAAAAQAVVDDRLRRFRRELFWRARAVLDMDPCHADFSHAVEEATALQRAVALATGALMQPGLLQSSTGLHYSVPADPTRTTTALESFFTLHRIRPLARRLLLTLTVERGLGRYSHAVRPLLLSCAVPRPAREEVDASFDLRPLGGTGGGGGAAGGLREVALNTAPLSGSGGAAGGGKGASAAAAAASASAALISGGMAAAAGFRAAGDGFGEGGEYILVLAQEGARGSGLEPIPAVGRFRRCVREAAEADGSAATPPERFPEQLGSAVVVPNLETAGRLADTMFLTSLSQRWDPQQEYLDALQEQQPHEGADDDGNDDEDDASVAATGDGGDEYNGEEDDDFDDEDRYFEAEYNTNRLQQQPQPAQATRRHEAGSNSDGTGNNNDEDSNSRGPLSVV